MAQPEVLQQATDRAEGLVVACRAYVDGVDGLLDALERDVYQAADRCWRLQDRPVQLRGGMLRHKTVTVQEAVFQPDAEQQELAGSLEQWRRAVQSSAASAALQVKVAEQQLVVVMARDLDPAQPAPPQQLAGLLDALLGAHGAVAALRKRSLRDTLSLLCQLAVQVATAWRAAGGDDAGNLLAGHEAAPQEVVAALSAPLPAEQPADAQAGALPSGGATLSGELAASLDKLRVRQAALLEELSDAADVLRFWSRRGEKAAAGDEAGVREGDVPPMLAEAQATLWAASQSYDDEQAASDLRTRQLVCQRYRPADLAALQAASDDYADGERVPAQPSLTYESEFVQERGYARTRALQTLHDDAMASAAVKLHQLRYLLLEAQLPPETAAAWEQLLVRIAEALLNGSTPPSAVPLLAELLQQGLRRQGAEELAGVGEQDKARLVPMICRGLAPQPGGRVLLRQHEGVGLLQSLLRPEAMLNGGQLTQFYDTLKMVVDGCAAAALPADTTASLLAPFDATRFAVLVCEQREAGGHGGGGGGSGGGSTATPHARVSMEQLLDLAHASLSQPGADSVGMALLEGVLTLQPAAFLGAALQLALACGGEQARRDVLGMLCRVPVELLPPPVVADALVQIAEAVDGNQLAPPFLPYELLGRLYRSAHVLRSMQLSVERGPEAAAAEAANEYAASFAGQKLWTARVGGTLSGGSGGDEAELAARAASGSSRMAEQGSEGGARRLGGSGNGKSSLVLLPLQPSGQPLAVLLQQVVGAVLSCLLRRAGGALDSASLSEELLQLLEVLLMPAAEQGGWLLQWLWSHLYQEALRPFLADASAAVGGGGGGGPLADAFLSYWASLPWRQSNFHAASPAALAAIRLHLVAAPADGAAAVLLRELDFAPVLAKAAPAQEPQRVQQVYSLVDEEEEEMGDAGDASGRGVWAAELALLALDCCVALPPQDQPDWLRQLLHGAPAQAAAASFEDAAGDAEDVAALMRSPQSAALMPLVAAAGEQQPLLPHLMAAADWRQLATDMHAEQAAAGAGAPWLLLPILLGPASMAGDVGGRLVHAASLLCRAAVLAGSPQAAQCAAGAVTPLLLCTLCQGTKHEPGSQRPQRAAAQAAGTGAAAAAAQAEAQRAQQEQVVIPEGFPLELLADTVEEQQLLLLQQQERERQELQQLSQLHLNDDASQQQQPAGAAPAAGAGAGEQQAGGEEQQQEQEQEQEQVLPLVEVQGCWSLTADQHAQLLQAALVPLGASQATLALAASLQLEHCPRDLASGDPACADGGLVQWRQPGLADLLHAASAAAAAAPSAPAEGRAADEAAGVAALLVPLARRPLTILTSDRLPFSNAELPLDTQAALYVSVAPESSGGSAGGGPGSSAAPSAAPQRRGLHQTLAALLPGARRRAQHSGLTPGAMDAQLLRQQLRLGLLAACKDGDGAPLAACLLRLVYACPGLHASAEAQALSEGVLRFLAAPERDGGPLGQGASASILLAATEPSQDAVAGGDLSVHSATAEVLSLEAAGAGANAQTPPAGVPSSPAGSSLRVAVTAAQGVPPSTLLGLAQGAAELHAPLTAALAVEQLRQGTTVLPKDEWQALVTQVLQVAVRADAEPGHPFDLVAAWLAALPWVADSRWRRLPSGPHLEALLEWLEALELRVVALRLAQPEDFGMEGGSPGGGSPNRLLSGAADRFKAVRQLITGQAPGAAGPSATHLAEDSGAGYGAAPSAEAGAGGGEQQLGQKLKSGFRSLLGKSGGREAAAAGQGAEGEPGHKGWGAKMRDRLARMGRGGEHDDQALLDQEAGEAPLGSVPPQLSARPGPYSASGLGTVAEEGGGTAGSEAAGPALGGPDAGHFGVADPAEGSGTGQAVKQKISSGFQAVGRSLSKVKTKLSDRQGAGGSSAGAAFDEVTDRDQDVAVRVGLAAFAVSAYIRAVLCPSLSSRLGSDSTGPATPTLARGAYHHRQTSSLGRLLDAEYMRELDRVLEARSELDSLEVLAACPMLQLHPGRYQAFLRDVPQLLSAATGVEAFSRSLVHLLFEPERALLVWM